MRKTKTNYLKKFEQFDPEPEVAINVERLQKLINMSQPLLGEISAIIAEDEDRAISIEYFNKINGAIEALEELNMMFK